MQELPGVARCSCGAISAGLERSALHVQLPAGLLCRTWLQIPWGSLLTGVVPGDELLVEVGCVVRAQGKCSCYRLEAEGSHERAVFCQIEIRIEAGVSGDLKLFK